jgi:hypothetical protein
LVPVPLGLQADVELMDRIGHFGFSELRFGDGTALGAKALTELRIPFEFEEAGNQGVNIAGRDEESGLVVVADFRCAIEGVGENGAADGHCLRQGARQSFTPGEMDEHIHGGDEIGNGCGGDETRENEEWSQLTACDGLLETAAPGAVADQEEPGVRTLADEGSGGMDKIVVTF